MSAAEKVYLLDYGAGNVQSLVNAVQKLGHQIKRIESVIDFESANKIIFPGVGDFGQAMQKLASLGYVDALVSYIRSDRPFMGICVGMQCLCLGSEEAPNERGLGILPWKVTRFDSSSKSVPHMGWNKVSLQQIGGKPFLKESNSQKNSIAYYFTHSYGVKVPNSEQEFLSISKKEWIYSTTTYGSETFVSSIRHGNIFATQFHPEKSGESGIDVLRAFLESESLNEPVKLRFSPASDGLSRRIIACLDVREDDHGQLVVTKGDQYDVRDTSGQIRNLGDPVVMASTYFQEGADEIAFLNITAHRSCPLSDLPMLDVLKRTSESVFVPLTIGGGIRDLVLPNGETVTALDVAGEYFRSGADKVSIGSDAVYVAERYHYRYGLNQTSFEYGKSSIEQIARVYGSQAVVVSIDPTRVYVKSPEEAHGHHVILSNKPGPNGESYCWYQCTVKGGRERRDLDVKQLVTCVQELGAGEILVNCMDADGTGAGFDLELLADVKTYAKIPVIASSGAGSVQHFIDVFERVEVEAALAAGIFHRQQVSIAEVKKGSQNVGLSIRL